MNINMTTVTPSALFDTRKQLFKLKDYAHLAIKNQGDFEQAKLFLQLNSRSEGTYTSYRREIERLLHWSWLIADKDLEKLSLNDLINYIEFCKTPPKSWISTKKVNKFISVNDARIPNPHWRPFVSILSKSEHKEGKMASIHSFKIGQNSVKEIIMILSTFFNFLIKKQYIKQNPTILLRQNYNLSAKTTSKNIKLNQQDLNEILSSSKYLADKNPALYERAYFILNLMINMGIKPSELVTKHYRTPLMSDITKDSNNYWYITLNNKYKRRLDEASLNALKRWRSYLSLSPLPYKSENIPLIPKQKGIGSVESTAHIRRIIQEVLDSIVDSLKHSGNLTKAKRYQKITASELCSHKYQNQDVLTV
ncbi:MAG: site-specific integrase [Gammaproteobacteria bacterium]|nr:MAG: site-specific integrase [Gammaproteobacteria bacterium]UTW42115.1 site-specific integrase [bacterium SCSIO 12844]